MTLREILAPYVPERLLADAEDAVSIHVGGQIEEAISAAYADGRMDGEEEARSHYRDAGV